MRAVLAGLVTLVVAAPALAADGEPRHAITKKDQTVARSIVLKRADLGSGFTVVARKPDDGLPSSARCASLDESDLTVTGDVDSPDFKLARGPVFVTVASTAQVYRTLREANTSWRRGSGQATAVCLADIVRLSAPKGQKIQVVSSKRVSFPALAPKTTAFRLVLNITLDGNQRIRAYIDAIVLQHGRVQSGLLFTSLGTPVGQADRVALASVVAARLAKAASPKGPVA